MTPRKPSAPLETRADWLARIARMGSIYECANWWKKHAPELRELSIADHAAVTQAFDAKRAEFEAPPMTDGDDRGQDE